MRNVARTPMIVALIGAILGLIFAGLSTYDYVLHLDRQMHDVHCSFIPGVAPTGDANNPCRTAMYSAYAAIMREQWWGGIPIALFAVGLYAFLVAYAITLLVGGLQSSRRSYLFFALTSLGPVGATIVMGSIAAFKLGTFCKTCVGLYAASIILAIGAVWAWLAVRKLHAFLGPSTGDQASVPELLPAGHPALFGAWIVGFGASALLPAALYLSALPDYRPKLLSCGKLPEPADTTKSLLKIPTSHPKRAAILFVDPLCPTCKGFHERLDAEGVIENLELTVALFPLDSACNWMIDRPVHPGSCVLSRAVLCADARAREALEWMYKYQEELAGLGKAGEPLLRAKIRERFGAELDACVDAKTTKIRLNSVLQYGVSNRITVSTPQFYLGDQRICDEDTDLGLRYTLGQLAPEVLR